MLRIALCDDEPEQINILKNHIIKILFHLLMEFDIFEFTSGDMLLNSYCRGAGYELVFLDISMTENNGINVAKQIHDIDRKVLIVFVTARADYVLKGYEARAFRYLLKPVNELMMEEVIKQALKEMQLVERGCINFKEKGENVRVDFDDIIYFEAQNHRILLVCTNAEHSFYDRLGDIEKRLAGKGFVRCQKGYLVNAAHIRRIGKAGILLDNGKILPVSSNYFKQTKEAFISTLR